MFKKAILFLRFKILIQIDVYYDTYYPCLSCTYNTGNYIWFNVQHVRTVW